MNTKISNLIRPGTYCAGFNPKTTIAALAISLCCFFSGCASLSDKMIARHKVKIKEESLDHLSGTYQLFPDLAYTQNGGAEMLRYKGKTERLHQYVGKSKMDFDPLANNTVTVKVLENKQINFAFKKDSLLVDTITLSAKLQLSGLLLLGNSYVKRKGVPYIFGGSESVKVRVGLASDDGLILSRAYDTSGAILIVLAAGHSSNLAYHFKRINSK